MVSDHPPLGASSVKTEIIGLQPAGILKGYATGESKLATRYKSVLQNLLTVVTASKQNLPPLLGYKK